MKKLFLIVVAFSLLGCKSLDYVRNQAPVTSGQSTKSVNDFSSCIITKWSGSGGYVSALPLANGTSVVVPQAMGGYDVVLDITKSSNGVTYILYERVPSLTSDSYEKAVNECR